VAGIYTTSTAASNPSPPRNTRLQRYVERWISQRELCLPLCRSSSSVGLVAIPGIEPGPTGI